MVPYIRRSQDILVIGSYFIDEGSAVAVLFGYIVAESHLLASVVVVDSLCPSYT